MDIDVPLGSTFIMRLTVDVVDLNLPFLLGIDVMDKYRLHVNTVSNHLVCVNEGVDLPVVRKYGNVYYDWDMATFYSFSELQRIHKNYLHVRPDRLYALMRRAKDKDAVPASLKKLKDLTDACDVCQRHRRRFCHRASLVTFRQFGGDTVWCPIETAAYDLEWPVGDLATQLFGSDGMSNG